MLDRRVTMDEDRYARRMDAATRRMIKPAGPAVDTLGQSVAAAIEFEAALRRQGDASQVTALQNEAQARQAGDQSNAAAIQTEATARSQVNTALGTRIDTLGTSTAAGLNAEAKARADADTALAADIAKRTRKYAQDIGNGVLTTFNIAHGLSTTDVLVQVFNKGAGNSLSLVTPATVTIVDANTVRLTFLLALTANGSRVVVVG